MRQTPRECRSKQQAASRVCSYVGFLRMREWERASGLFKGRSRQQNYLQKAGRATSLKRAGTGQARLSPEKGQELAQRGPLRSLLEIAFREGQMLYLGEKGTRS